MYATSRTPIVASTNVSGTARPTVRALPCGLMFAAIDGAIRASETPTASQMVSSLRSFPVGGGASASPMRTSESSMRSVMCSPSSS